MSFRESISSTAAKENATPVTGVGDITGPHPIRPTNRPLPNNDWMLRSTWASGRWGENPVHEVGAGQGQRLPLDGRALVLKQ